MRTWNAASRFKDERVPSLAEWPGAVVVMPAPSSAPAPREVTIPAVRTPRAAPHAAPTERGSVQCRFSIE